MAETIKIEIFRNKNADEFTAALADPDSRLETGSGAAATAAVAAAFLCRAAALTARTILSAGRVDSSLSGPFSTTGRWSG